MLYLLSYYLLMQLRNGARGLISSCTQVKKELKTSLYLRASVVRLFALSILFHVHFYIGWTLCSSVFKSRHASQGGGGGGHRKWNRSFSYTSAKRHGAGECDDLLCCSKCWVLRSLLCNFLNPSSPINNDPLILLLHVNPPNYFNNHWWAFH